MTSDGGWREAGAGDVHVDGASLWEKGWGAGAIERGYAAERYWWGGSRTEGKINDSGNRWIQVGQEG